MPWYEKKNFNKGKTNFTKFYLKAAEIKKKALLEEGFDQKINNYAIKNDKIKNNWKNL